ncbi:unnamed protein product [Cyclocybe aegerita]|uniref:F-box domain-containing protein n=1 Tax=Cyclocybe aegerita TaxID=1973307 RepID=A0A8S0XTS1_CYCAE|nr:unnamed protein product [Cyclocybe aegerita]
MFKLRAGEAAPLWDQATYPKLLFVSKNCQLDGSNSQKNFVSMHLSLHLAAVPPHTVTITTNEVLCTYESRGVLLFLIGQEGFLVTLYTALMSSVPVMPSLAFPDFSSFSSFLKSVHHTIPKTLAAIAAPSFDPSQCGVDAVNRLPDELLSEICVLALTETKTDLSLSPVFSEEFPVAPFALSHVCRRWRHVVTEGTPLLWSSIAVIHPNHRHVFRTKVWMSYVQGPVKIFLNQSDSPSDEEQQATTDIIQSFLSRVDRWQTVVLHIRGQFPSPILGALDRLRRIPSPWLNAVDFSFLSFVNGREDPRWAVLPCFTAWDTLQNIPSLTSLSWQTAFTPGPRFGAQLTRVALHSPISIEDLLDKLIYCHNLSDLEILALCRLSNMITVLPEHEDIPPDPLPILSLPALRRLCLQARVDITPLLERLHTPSLTNFILIMKQAAEWTTIKKFITLSECRLYELMIEFAVPLSEAELIDCLEMPELRWVHRLGMHNAEVTNKILLMLHRPAQQGVQTFEYLIFLWLGRCRADVDPATLLRMLGSRFWTILDTCVPPTELESAHIGVDADMVTGDMAEYERVINACSARTKGWNRNLTFFDG